MGVQNYLIEGSSGAGKTSVCDELIRRGFQAIHGDRELAYMGDPETGQPTEIADHDHHIWDIEKVKSLMEDQTNPITFFCGGSRNFHHFIDLFDEVFILDVDLNTLLIRLNNRPKDEWGGQSIEREFIASRHQTKEDLPKTGTIIDATNSISKVVDEILRKIGI